MPQNEIEETRGRLVRSASTITPLTLLSRVTGYLRDKVIAVTLGAGLRSDAFFVAFRIPNMLREIIGEGAMSSALIPVYVGVSAERSEEEARAFVGRIAATFALLLAGITVVGILISPWLVSLLAAQFRETPGKFELTVTLNRWIFPYILLVSLSALCQALLNAHRRFAVSAAAPILLNVSMILAALSSLAPPRGSDLRAGRRACSSAALSRSRFSSRCSRACARSAGRRSAGSDPAVRSVLLLMAPRLLAYGISRGQYGRLDALRGRARKRQRLASLLRQPA